MTTIDNGIPMNWGKKKRIIMTQQPPTRNVFELAGIEKVDFLAQADEFVLMHVDNFENRVVEEEEKEAEEEDN